MIDMHNFSQDKKRAIEQMLDMNKKAVNRESVLPQNTANNVNTSPKNHLGKFSMSMSQDDILIIGLILILSGDCRDMWLFLALLYILM